jgi:flagellar biosynthesis protein FlhF
MEVEMKIKRYMAVSMRAALAQVRTEQGPDAVILSSRRVEEGIEVIAAVDYDEALFADATVRRAREETAPAAPYIPTLDPGIAVRVPAEPDQPIAKIAAAMTATRKAAAALVGGAQNRAPAARPLAAAPVAARPVATKPVAAAPPAAEVRTAPVAAAPISVPIAAVPAASLAAGAARSRIVRASVDAAPTPAPVPAQDAGFLAMQQEVRHLREMLQGQLAHMSWNDKRLREPLQARVLEELTALDIAPDIAMALAAATPRNTSLENPSHIPLAMLVRHLPVVDKLTTVNGGVIALVGPTGAGKTTTIAKLAAHWSMQHGPNDLALVSTDGYRIGAREQLMTYARILGAPMHVANSGKELAKVLDRLKSKKLVLIDTAGMGPRDVRLSEQLAALQLGAARARVLLALPAHGEANALEEIVRSFSRVSPVACILTKVDEAASLGAVISTTLRHKLRIAYLCTGQRVPEDLHPAHERRLWLIRVALKLKAHAPPRVNTDGYYARNFGRDSAHA